MAFIQHNFNINNAKIMKANNQIFYIIKGNEDYRIYNQNQQYIGRRFTLKAVKEHIKNYN